MKRDNIEFMIGWLDALRRDERNALRAGLDANVIWQGLRHDWICHNADEVVEAFTAGRERFQEIGALDNPVLHAGSCRVLRSLRRRYGYLLRVYGCGTLACVRPKGAAIGRRPAAGHVSQALSRQRRRHGGGAGARGSRYGGPPWADRPRGCGDDGEPVVRPLPR